MELILECYSFFISSVLSYGKSIIFLTDFVLSGTNRVQHSIDISGKSQCFWFHLQQQREFYGKESDVPTAM